MRYGLAGCIVGLVSSVGVGCASRPVEDSTARVSCAAVCCRQLDNAVMASATASALVFDVPGAAEHALLDLSREPRERGAFIGYEEQTTSFYYLNVDDNQRSGGKDHYDRHDYVERTGVTYR